MTELPSNLLHVMRRIRRCENETAAQLVLEHFAREIERRTLERAVERCMTILGYPPREYYAQAIRALMEQKNA